MSFATPSQESLLPEEDYELSLEESHYYHTVSEIAEMVDEYGLDKVLKEITGYVNNPQDQHLLNQLTLLLENYENVLLSFTPAHVLLDTADRFKHVSELKGVGKRKQWWEE